MNAPIDKTRLQEFRKLDRESQLRQLRGQKVERAFAIERDGAIDEKARTAWLSIASEAPYERWWGVEILDMKSKSIRDERLRMGAPLLVGHDSDRQVGVVESFEITQDKKLRILARFGRSALAEEIFRDVLDGIRRNASVGYIIHDLVLERQEEDVATYRVTDWEPLEGSLVPIPADPSVGVGRSLGDPSAPLPKSKDTMDPKDISAEVRAQIAAEERAKIEKEARERAAAEANSPENVAKREQERVSAILAAGKEFNDLELAAELARDAKATVETFKARLLEKQRGAQKTLGLGGDVKPNHGEAVRVHYQHAPLKGFRDLAIAGGGVMKAEEAAYRSGMWIAAQIHKKDWAIRRCKEMGIGFSFRDIETGQVRVMNENVLSQGAALVPVEMEASIIQLRDSYGVARKLVRVRPMNGDTLQIARRKGGITAYFFQDDDGVGITASDKAWDNVNLHTKKVGALGKLSRDLVEDAIIGVADDMVQEQAYAFAKLEDQCFIIGDGTSTYGGIQGIQTKFDNNAYVSRYAAASSHHVFTTIDNADLTGMMASVSQYAYGPGACFLTSAAGKGAIFDRLKAIAGGNRVDTLGMPTGTGPSAAPGSEYLGYPIYTSEACRNGIATDYTNKTILFFGRFDLAASMGSRRGIEVQVLQERYAELGLIGVISTERFDLVVHDLGDTSSVKGPVAGLYGA